MSDIDTGRKSFMVRIATGGATTGALASRATYSYSTDGGSTWSAAMPVSTGGADTTAGDIVIDATNNTFYRNGTAVTLTGGTYTEIPGRGGPNPTRAGIPWLTTPRRQARRRQQHRFRRDLQLVERRFHPPRVSRFRQRRFRDHNGNTDTGDYDAGMFIDGRAWQRHEQPIKFAFGTRTRR